jgi:hypothetical protein
MNSRRECPAAFWVDEDYDRAYASDGVSRYGAYLRDAAFEPWTDEDQAVELAVFAWERATRPVMAPGYVRCHPRVITARLERSDWDGSLVARVDLVAPQPRWLRGLLAGDGGGVWRDWPIESLTGEDAWYWPGGQDLTRGCYSLASLSLRFAVLSTSLPDPRLRGAGLAACREAVAVVAAELDRAVGPVLTRLGEG